MPPPRPHAWPALPCVLLWTACASPGPPVLVRPVVPSALLSCQPAPAPPDLASDTALALWIVDLAAAGEDCRGRLERVKDLLDAR